MQRRPIFPCRVRQSIFGANELNFCVRDGNRWDLAAIVTAMVYIRVFSPYISFFLSAFRQIDNCIEHLQDHICQAYFQFALFSSLRDQALDLLVSVGSTHHCAYTPDLSTSSSIRGLTNLCYGISYLEASFTLRCFQRLSRPHFAFLPCRWRDNRCTIGAFIPVLSY